MGFRVRVRGLSGTSVGFGGGGRLVLGMLLRKFVKQLMLNPIILGVSQHDWAWPA